MGSNIWCIYSGEAKWRHSVQRKKNSKTIKTIIIGFVIFFQLVSLGISTSTDAINKLHIYFGKNIYKQSVNSKGDAPLSACCNSFILLFITESLIRCLVCLSKTILNRKCTTLSTNSNGLPASSCGIVHLQMLAVWHTIFIQKNAHKLPKINLSSRYRHNFEFLLLHEWPDVAQYVGQTSRHF